MTDLLPEEERRKVTILLGADAADSSKVLPLVRQMHRESLFSDLPFDPELYERICVNIRDDSGYHGAIYFEYEGDPIAFAYFQFRPFMGSRKTWITIMHTMYLRADIRSTPLGGYVWQRIVLAVRAWSTPRGSRGLMFNVLSGVAVPDTDTLLRASGASHLGGNYFLRI